MRIEELGKIELVVDIHANREVWDELFSHLGTRPSGTSVFSLLQCGEYLQDSTAVWEVGDALWLEEQSEYLAADQMREGTYEFIDRANDNSHQFFLGCDILVEKGYLHVGDHEIINFDIWW